jgi:hypothetical protein
MASWHQSENGVSKIAKTAYGWRQYQRAWQRSVALNRENGNNVSNQRISSKRRRNISNENINGNNMKK